MGWVHLPTSCLWQDRTWVHILQGQDYGQLSSCLGCQGNHFIHCDGQFLPGPILNGLQVDYVSPVWRTMVAAPRPFKRSGRDSRNLISSIPYLLVLDLRDQGKKPFVGVKSHEKGNKAPAPLNPHEVYISCIELISSGK